MAMVTFETSSSTIDINPNCIISVMQRKPSPAAEAGETQAVSYPTYIATSHGEVAVDMSIEDVRAKLATAMTDNELFAEKIDSLANIIQNHS